MKSTRRHELQQNTLNAELAKLVGFFRKHGTKISWAVLIAALIFLVVVLWNRRQQQKDADLAARYSAVIPSISMVMYDTDDEKAEGVIDGLKKVVEDGGTRPTAADAALQIANLCAARVPLQTDPAGRQKWAQRARDGYQAVLAKYTDNAPAIGAAHAGLGRLAETEGDFATARREFQAVVDTPSLKGYPVYAAAQSGLEGLDTLSAPIPLAATMPAILTEETSTAPTSSTAPTTSSAPAGEPTGIFTETQPAPMPTSLPATPAPPGL